MKIFYFLFEIIPAPGSAHFDDSGGAYINCWIKSNSLSDAESVAKQFIHADEWQIVDLDESFVAERNRYLDDPETLELFDEAHEEGQSYCFHIWPPEPQEDDTVN